MSEGKPIRISGSQAAEWGLVTLDLAKSVIRQAVEEKVGKPHEWRQLTNMDAIELVPVEASPSRDEAKAFARVDLFEDHVAAQFLPGSRDRVIRCLLLLVDGLVKGANVPFLQTDEVEAVKQ